LFSRGQVLRAFFADGKGTKHQLAETLAQRFPEQLGLQLPGVRRAWESEDPRMSIFMAMTLVVMFRLKSVSHHRE
jgi:hypothetical protein